MQEVRGGTEWSLRVLQLRALARLCQQQSLAPIVEVLLVGPHGLCMPGLPSKGPLRPSLSAVPSGPLALLPAFSGPACRGAHGHTLASAHQLHDLSACQACLPMARCCLPSLSLHVPNVWAKLVTLRGAGVTGLHLDGEAQNSF